MRMPEEEIIEVLDYDMDYTPDEEVALIVIDE